MQFLTGREKRKRPMTSDGFRTVAQLFAAVAIAGSMLACAGTERALVGPSAIVASSDTGTLAASFGAPTTDLASCLVAPSPACFSASSLRAATQIRPTALAAPINLSSTVVGTTVTLLWTEPAGTSSRLLQGTAASYVIEAGSSSGLANLASFSTGNSLTTFTATGVAAGTYYVRVRAVDSSVTAGPPSNEVVVVVGGSGCVPPGAPTGLTTTTNTGGTVGLRWNAASGVPTSYGLEAGSAPGTANLANTDVGAVTTFTATGVGPGTYFVRVRAKNACGTSAPSNEVTIVVVSAPIPAPTPSPTPVPPIARKTLPLGEG